MLKLKCECCGIEQEFADSQEAFDAGWDDPGHFTIITCNLCPASYLVLGINHEAVHQKWAQNGRPKEFGPDCVNEDPVSQGFFRKNN